jgi:hypothetical protein
MDGVAFETHCGPLVTAGGRADLVDAGLLSQRAKVSSPAAVRSGVICCAEKLSNVNKRDAAG